MLHTITLSRITKYLLCLVSAILILYAGKTFFIPLFFGLLIAVLLYPACKWLERKKFPRALAITVLLVTTTLVFVLLLWLLGYELNLFIANLPGIKSKMTNSLSELSAWVQATFPGTENKPGIPAKIFDQSISNLRQFTSAILSTTVSTVLMLVMIPIYSSLFLYHRGTFIRFVLSLLPLEYGTKILSVMHESIITYFKFIKGTFFVYCIVGVLNSIGLLLLGIDHAVLFGMITAFMTAIPYVGILISAALPISVALVTKDSIWYPVGVIAVFTFVQYLEANIIFPKVVGQQLNLSTWAVLSAVIIGTLIWGIAGMILFIPFTAILKIISDNMKELKPLNILLNREEGYKGAA
jgi:predicted PurR-regulated permease PerM